MLGLIAITSGLYYSDWINPAISPSQPSFLQPNGASRGVQALLPDYMDRDYQDLSLAQDAWREIFNNDGQPLLDDYKNIKLL